MRKLAFIASILMAAFILTGCGGPKYSAEVRAAADERITKGLPMQISALVIEELSGGEPDAVFSFTGEYLLTDNLYDGAPPLRAMADLRKVDEIRAKLFPFAALISKTKFKAASDDLAAELSAPLPYFHIVTPRGTRKKFAGNGLARLTKDGSWEAQILELNCDFPAGGTPSMKNWLLEGSREAKAYEAKIAAKMKEFKEAAAEADKLILAAKQQKSSESKILEDERRIVEAALMRNDKTQRD